jgi:3-oxoacyl-ACP reductase-like protein
LEPPRPDHPVLHRDDVCAPPDVAAATGASKEGLWTTAIQQALDVLHGNKPLVNSVVTSSSELINDISSEKENFDMDQRLIGKVALVTGASKGIGQGLAIGLARAGASVAVNFRSDAKGAEATCKRISEAGREADAFQVNIASKAEFERLIDQVYARFGRLDIW